MGRKATGTVYGTSDGNAGVRIWLGAGVRVSVLLHRPAAADDTAAAIIAEHGHELFARHHLTRDQVRDVLTELARRARHHDARAVVPLWREWVRKGVALGLARAASTPELVPSVQQFGDGWTGGVPLPRKDGERPSVMKRRKSHAWDQTCLMRYVYPHIGAMPITSVRKPHMKQVCEAAAGSLSERTVVYVWNLMLRLVNISVELGWQETCPISKGGRPEVSKRVSAELHPEDDASVLGCTRTPLARRILWGFQAREGQRVADAMYAIRWHQIDVHGTVHVWQGKTQDRAHWVLQPDTYRALMLWRALTGAQLTDLVFGRLFAPGSMAVTFRRDLIRAGVHIRRPELFVDGAEGSGVAKQVRGHDLRALFVTMAIASGKPDSFIRHRTLHKDARMIETYTRAAAILTATHRTQFVDMVDAIPELRALRNASAVPSPAAAPAQAVDIIP